MIGKITRLFSASSLLLCLLFWLSACATKVEKAPEHLWLIPTSFDQLPGWNNDQQSEALRAFAKSCAVLLRRDPSATFVLAEAGQTADWVAACQAAVDNPDQTDEEARHFFEAHFMPHLVQNGEGLFTGYYEAQLNGSWQRTGRYQTPLWGPPRDMLTIELGAFRESLKGQKITGKIDGSKFIPFDDRQQIAAGSLSGRAEPLVWVDDPVSAFFLEIQGSGQIRFEDGTLLRVGYAAQNGHGYTPVGRVLLERGEIERPVTMQKIRAWMQKNPSRAQDAMNANPSVVFFKRSDKAGAVGAQGVTLTPMRSMAVDPSFVPLGVPLWLSTNEHKRLVVAQDTGGAIKGAVRGDLFWGAGAQAEQGAGNMQNPGTYMILLPKGRTSR